MNDLEFQVFKAPSLGLIGSGAETGVGMAESIDDLLFSTAGDYLIRVLGRQDTNQFYQLDLSFSEVPTPEENADFDGDLDVDGEDFLIWQRGAGIGATLSQGDANGDAIVDGLDLDVWKEQFGMPDGPSGTNAGAVPEPNTLLLAASLVGLVMAVRRRAA